MPAAFFAALDQGLTTNADGSESGGGVVDDALRADFLRLSRGFAIVLLVVYAPVPSPTRTRRSLTMPSGVFVCLLTDSSKPATSARASTCTTRPGRTTRSGSRPARRRRPSSASASWRTRSRK